MSRTTSTRHVNVTVGLSILCGVFLTACGSASPSASSSGAATSPGTSTASGAGSSSGNGAVPTTCPTQSVVSAAAGMTYPAPSQQASSGSLFCTYADPTSGANLVMVVTTAPGTTPSVLQAVAQSQATAQHVTASSVAGLGDAAYSITLDDATTNSLHVDTSIVLAVKGSVTYDVTAEATLPEVEAVVRLLLG